MNQREFTKICKSHGFLLLAPDFYARCMGDGIYQSIYTGFRKYIHPSSPYYNADHFKSRCISISVRSLYASWVEQVFVPGPNGMGIYPFDLLGRSAEPFHGIEHEYECMQNQGFYVLDAIDSQSKLIELHQRVYPKQNGIRKHSTSLIAPFLLSGDIENAVHEICYAYTHRRAGFYKANSHLLVEGKVETFYQQDICDQANSQELQSLWYAWLSGDHQFFAEYIRRNISLNLKRAEKYQIPFMQDFSLIEIPTRFF